MRERIQLAKIKARQNDAVLKEERHRAEEEWKKLSEGLPGIWGLCVLMVEVCVGVVTT